MMKGNAVSGDGQRKLLVSWIMVFSTQIQGHRGKHCSWEMETGQRGGPGSWSDRPNG